MGVFVSVAGDRTGGDFPWMMVAVGGLAVILPLIAILRPKA
jgi:hypothetical protein